MMSTAAAIPRSPLRACFDLARAGNFPSVVSNVIAALVLSDPAGPVWPSGEVLALAVLAGCLTYAGGATLNDVADTEFDLKHRPERAIPRGVLSRTSAAMIGTLEMLLGLGLLIGSGAAVTWTAALGATILAYDWVHKRWSGSVVLMAGCRALLAIAIASLPGHVAGTPFRWWVAALFTYIVTLSLIARREYAVKRAASASASPNLDPPRAATLGRLVGRLLAFMPLIDALALLVIGAWIPAFVCAMAVPVGRWAQRLAAST